MTKYIVKSLYCFHLCSVLHQCHPYSTSLKFHCKTELSTSLPFLSIWAFSQEQWLCSPKCPVKWRNFLRSILQIEAWGTDTLMSAGLTHFKSLWFDFLREPGILLHYVSPQQCSFHWKLQACLISFQQVRLKGSDKKSRNWRTHRHHLWEISVKWCD